MEATYMSINKLMNREDVIHTYSGVLLSHKKNEVMPFAAKWMDTDCHTERSKSERGYISYDIAYMCSKKWYK